VSLAAWAVGGVLLAAACEPAPPPSLAPSPPAVPSPGGPLPAAAPADRAGDGGIPPALAIPSPVAFPCHDDLPCGTYRCNADAGRCAFPCVSAIDCAVGHQCAGGLCVRTRSGADAGQ
jgi:hypothetical protein